MASRTCTLWRAAERDEVYRGHLEEGSEVLYLAEIAILVFNEHRMARADRSGKLITLELVEYSQLQCQYRFLFSIKKVFVRPKAKLDLPARAQAEAECCI